MAVCLWPEANTYAAPNHPFAALQAVTGGKQPRHTELDVCRACEVVVCLQPEADNLSVPKPAIFRTEPAIFCNASHVAENGQFLCGVDTYLWPEAKIGKWCRSFPLAGDKQPPHASRQMASFGVVWILASGWRQTTSKWCGSFSLTRGKKPCHAKTGHLPQRGKWLVSAWCRSLPPLSPSPGGMLAFRSRGAEVAAGGGSRQGGLPISGCGQANSERSEQDARLEERAGGRAWLWSLSSGLPFVHPESCGGHLPHSCSPSSGRRHCWICRMTRRRQPEGRAALAMPMFQPRSPPYGYLGSGLLSSW